MWYASECWAYRTTTRRFSLIHVASRLSQDEKLFFVELFWNNMYGVIGERQHHKSALFNEFNPPQFLVCRVQHVKM